MSADPLSTPTPTPVHTDTIDLQMRHRTIRAYADTPVSEDQMTTLLEVARATATTAFLQQFTIIHIRDHAIRQRIAAVTGQPYVGGDRAELLIFVADLYRNAQIRAEGGLDDEPLGRINLFMQAMYDTCLAAQNVVVAAESMGLGTTYLGSINTDPREVIAALNLPRLTYPIFGLLVGHPAQDPQFKPRLPLAVTTGVDTYPFVDSYEDTLAEYDEVVQHYYDLRDTSSPIPSFTRRIRQALGTGGSETSPILEILHEQGLALR
ncbi:MAG: NADPH-dependent oxidoreductase [Actinomycetaceae bacterium]|nr:NADPH-dependent oxidoreductase [Actinomycetaceae bacterium]